jgi:hypothetical protein
MTTFDELAKARENQNNNVSDSNIQIDPNNVNPTMCISCPFRKKGIGSEYGEDEQQLLRENIIIDALTNSNRLCHHRAIESLPEDVICRGARNIQLQYFYELGVLDAPTDEAWANTLSSLCKAKLDTDNDTYHDPLDDIIQDSDCRY